MKTETIIKKQAKDALKGNWPTLIAAVLFICTIFVLLENIVNLFDVGLKIVSVDSGQVIKGKEPLYVCINGFALLMFVFVCPLINGVIKIFYDVSKGLKADISSLFFYFSNAKLYFTTVLLDLILLIVYSVLSYGLDVYAYASLLTRSSLSSGFEFSVTNALLFAALIVSVAVKILAYFLFVHFSLFAYADDCSKSIGFYTYKLFGFSTAHFGASIKLLFGFIGWGALCFFVVPAFYVLPYMAESFAMSSKWLFALKNDRGLLC